MPRRIDIPVGDLLADYAAGRSIRQLAKIYGVSYGTAHDRLVKGGVRRRARGGAHRLDLARLPGPGQLELPL